MTTLLQLADRAQLTLNDSGAGTWPQDTVEEWVIDGIRDYSQQFPRTTDYTITVSGGSPGHAFNMSLTTVGVVLVEYPGDQDPPVYLKRRNRTHPQFYGTPGYYDWEPTNDQTVYPQLYLSEEPSDGEKITITLTTHHDVDLLSGEDLTIPAHHEGLIILFVLWQAFKERLSTQEQDPDTSLAGNVTFLQQLVKGAEQAEAEYRRALARTMAARSESSLSGPWTADEHDRIY